METWMPIIDFEGIYEGSNYGNVRSLNFRRTGETKRLNPGKDKQGYLYVCLMKNGTKNWEKVHRIIWEAFNGPIPDGYEINHINEDKSDNRLENLSIVTHKENINHGTCSKRAGEKHHKPVVQYDLDGKCICRWESMSKAGAELNIDVGQISACCKHKPHYNTAGGYRWEYK